LTVALYDEMSWDSFRTVFRTENDKLTRTLANSHELKIADFRESVFAIVRGKPLKPAFNQ